MAANVSGLGALLCRRRVLQMRLAEIVKSIAELPPTSSDDIKTFYRDHLLKWNADMEALQESIAPLCGTDEEFETAMQDFSPLIQSYNATLLKLSHYEKAAASGTGDIPSNACTSPPSMEPSSHIVAAAATEISSAAPTQGISTEIIGFKATNSKVTVQGDVSIAMHYTPPNPLVGQRIYFNVRGVPSGFYGRESDLNSLTSAFQNAIAASGEKTNKSNTIIIHGMPGAGKTSLAAAFIRRCGDKLKNFDVLWISAESKRSIRDQFVQVCDLHFPGLPLKDKDGNLKNDQDVMSIIYNQLTQNPSMIIFDNAASALKTYGIKEEIADFFCKSVPPGNHHPVYLVTTRTAAPEVWKGYNATMLKLSCFSEDDCWSYMQTELSVLAHHKDECRRLWEFFDRLPIAIEHAVNIMAYEASLCDEESSYSPHDFVNMALAFETTSCEKVEGMDMEPYEKLNRLWDYSLELLRNVPNAGEYAIHVLDVMALLSSTGIPVNFLRQIVQKYAPFKSVNLETGKDNKHNLLDRAVGLLIKFNVVQKTNPLIYIHVLLQEHRRNFLKEEFRLETHVVAVAESMIECPELTSYLMKTEYAHNFQNISHVCNAVDDYVQNSTSDLNLRCALFVQNCLPLTALRLLPKSDDSLETLKIKSTCYSNLGNYQLALQYTQALYQIQDLHFSEEHPDTLSTKSNMAAFHSDLGDYREALRLSKEVCDVRCRVLGEEHPKTLTSKTNMANQYSELGDYAEALRLSKEMCDVSCRVLGEEHPDTLSTKSNMAAFHSDLGDYKEALRLSKEVCDARCRVLGEEHPDTLKIKSNVANRYSELGDYAEALRLSKEVCDVSCRVLGEEHPYTLSTKSNMANFHSDLGDYTEAFRLAKEVCDARCRVLGEEHPDTLSTKSNMANFHSDLGDYKEALRLSKEVCDARCRVLGEEHPDTLKIKSNVARLHLHLGNYAEALLLSTDAYVGFQSLYGNTNPTTLNAQKLFLKICVKSGLLAFIENIAMRCLNL